MKFSKLDQFNCNFKILYSYKLNSFLIAFHLFIAFCTILIVNRKLGYIKRDLINSSKEVKWSNNENFQY